MQQPRAFSFSPQNGPPDGRSALAAGRTWAGQWRFLVGQSTGPQHTREGGSCEDSWAAASPAGGSCYALAVADGAGSAARASEGSAMAAQIAVWSLVTSARKKRLQAAADWQAAGRQALSDARAALVRLADQVTERGTASGRTTTRVLRQFDTTLLLVAVTPAYEGCGGAKDLVMATAVGDGAIVIADQQGLRCVAVGERAEYVNETYFLTETDYAAHCATYCELSDQLSGVALLTDGVEALAVSHRGREPYPPFFEAVFAHVAAGGDADGLIKVLTSPLAVSRSADDKTIAVLARRSEASD